MAAQKEYLKLAKSLPPRLSNFFAKYPTPALLEPTPGTHPKSSPAPTDTTYFNPFKAQKHPITGRYHDPIFSLRRQADLVKLARAHGVEELLPFTIKGTAERLRRKEENGLRGQKVKGKEWERTMKGRLQKRKQAMLDMPQLIQTWKERGHGRGWKKWPKP